MDFEDGGPICIKLHDVIAQLSAQIKFISGFRKIAPFRDGGQSIVTWVKKFAQNVSRFDPL